MATGYTAPVQEGKVTTLREFALFCARAFGANVMMRDESIDVPIREYQPSTYHLGRLKEAQERLAKVERMGVDPCRVEADKEHADMTRSLNEAIARKDKERQRYELMLTQVESWNPPTDDHREFKKFMMSQLRQSIDFDCYDPRQYIVPQQLNGAAWKEREIKEAKEDIEYHRKHHEEEVQRTNDRNAWNRALLDSLK